MTHELASPDVLNYAVLKGNVYFTPAGGSRRHLGNAPQFQLELGVDKLDHFSSMTGVKTKDQSIVLEKTCTLTMSIEEVTLKNLQLALLGDSVNSDTDTTDGGLQGFDIGVNSQINGVVELIGSNDVGPQYKVTLPSVNFTPSNAIDFIGDDWAIIELTGDVLAVNGSFGRLDQLGTSATTT